MSEPNYGSFESYPARFTLYEAWVLIDNVWRNFNAAEVCHSATVLEKTEFNTRFGKVNNLPKTAFQSGE